MINDLSTKESAKLYIPDVGVELIIADDDLPTASLVLPPIHELKELNKPVSEVLTQNQGMNLILHDKYDLEIELNRLREKNDKFYSSYTYLNHVATLSEYIGDQNTAIRLWTEADKLCDQPMFKHKLGESLIRQSKLDEAGILFSKLELDKDVIANLRLAYITISIGDIQQSLQYAMQALDIDPLNFRANWIIGILHTLSGRYAESISWLRQAIDINPHSYALYYNIAIAHIMLNQEHKAVGDLRKAISLNPMHEDSLLLYESLIDPASSSQKWYEDAIKTCIKFKPNVLYKFLSL